MELLNKEGRINCIHQIYDQDYVWSWTFPLKKNHSLVEEVVDGLILHVKFLIKETLYQLCSTGFKGSFPFLI